ETGELYQPDDFTILDWDRHGTAMLQDGIWADTDRLESDDDYRQQASAFVKASLKGWIYCRDNPDECVGFILDHIGVYEWHQQWMMNEVNQLIWPAPRGIGVVNPNAWD